MTFLFLFYAEHFLPRLSTHGRGDFGSHTSGTGGWGLCFGVFQHFYTMNISPGLRGGNQLAGGSLVAVAAILIRIQAEREGRDFFWGVCQLFYTMYISPGLRGGNRLAGGSLLTVAAILDRIQAELEGVDLVSVCFNN